MTLVLVLRSSETRRVATFEPSRADLDAARRGDRLAFARLFDGFAPMVHGVLIAHGPSSEVDDLVQDVFLTALERLSSMDSERVGPWLAAIVTVSALITVWTADRVLLSSQEFNPARLAFQVGHIIPFAVLSGIALWRIDRPDMHKRLMLLAVFATLDTGWSRWLASDLREILGTGLAQQLLARFPLTWALMAGMAIYDRVTRRRLHPSFLPAAALILATEFGAAALYFAPWWPDLARRLLGG